MYTAILFSDLTWDFVSGVVMHKEQYPNGVKFFGVPPETTVEAFVEWVALGMPAKDLIEY